MAEETNIELTENLAADANSNPVPAVDQSTISSPV